MNRLQSMKSNVNNHILEVHKSLDKYGRFIEEAKNIGIISDEKFHSICLLAHSVYNGIENILQEIFKYLECEFKGIVSVKNTNKKEWHKMIIDLAFSGYDNLPVILKNENKLLSNLSALRGFRHAVRHKYIHHLDWNKVKEGIVNLKSIWDTFVRQIADYFENLEITLRGISSNPLKRD